MTFDIASARLESQLLTNQKFKSVKAIVSHFGAVQAQDYPMSQWAVGSRLPGSTETTIENAIDKGEIIRTHVLRPTWHLIAAEDIHWMLELTGGNILRQMNSMNRQLGLDEKVFSKSIDIITKALDGGNHLTRDELNEILNHSGIQTNNYRGLHILAHAELHRIIGSGKRKGKHHSYALLDERVKSQKKLNREEALAELANRYFTSHGPATLKDFGWWSGLSVSDTKLAVELNNKKIICRDIDGQTYWAKSFGKTSEEQSVFLLPAFDEFLISYKDRSASIPVGHSPKAFTVNGIFKPILIVNGQVIGIWKRTIKKDKVTIEFTFFEKRPMALKNEITAEAEKFAAFIGKTPEIIF